ncbi:hypothetical protein ERX46_16720 [Brumimicrobium glaciale]|uniref:Uncharacterized protein n=1 Tax=Brumimicrobium glaciale TaxID=200475 RepID=A0A4Q4KEG8_9FLAO|nr:hypothetical protein [Brumimicrobium glaciale]RYM31325.1 hypothetical protein ERX46_16720 [Brumimicrobium glaciale]
MKNFKFLLFVVLLSTTFDYTAQEKEMSRNEIVFDSLVKILNSDPEFIDFVFSETGLDEEEIIVFKEILNSLYTEILEKNDIRASDENELLNSISVMAEMVEIHKNILQFNDLPSPTEITSDTSISKLPFTYKNVKHSTSIPLPKIDSVIYLALNTGFDFNFKDREILNHLQTFNNQLPNIGKYYVYYTELDCAKALDSISTSVCSGFANLTAGFLIFYDSITKHAHIINIQNAYFIDSAIDLDFFIDMDYKIYLTETGMTDGVAEDGETIIMENYFIIKYLIEIEKNGNFQITESELE